MPMYVDKTLSQNNSIEKNLDMSMIFKNYI